MVDSMVVARAWQLLEGWLFNEPSFRFLGSPAQPSLRPCSRRHQNQLQGWNLWQGAGEKDRCRRPSEAQSQRTDPSESESLSTGQQCIDTKPPKKMEKKFEGAAERRRRGRALICHARTLPCVTRTAAGTGQKAPCLASKTNSFR